MDAAKFARWFRDSSPYIRAHRHKVFLVHLTAEALAHKLHANLTHDLALLHVLGVRLILVPSLSAEVTGSSQVIDQKTLQTYIGGVAEIRNRLEALFANGIPVSHFHARHISLVSGNFLQAKPKGIVNGIDTGFAGEIRQVHQGEIRKMLDAETVVMVPPLGYSSTGEMYTLDPNEVVIQVALNVGTDKVILVGPIARIGDHSSLTTSALDEVLAEVPLSPAAIEQLQTLGTACRQGIPRAHVVSHEIDGALLQELFTAVGTGTQISDSAYRDIRPARGEDISSIAELLKPLEDEGVMLDRSRTKLVEEPQRFLVAELDGVIIGCVAIYGELEEEKLEIGSLVTSPEFQGANVGRQLLQAAEREAERRGANAVFVLTVNAMDWFKDNGYETMNLQDLPSSRLDRYSTIRNSIPLLKRLSESNAK